MSSSPLPDGACMGRIARLCAPVERSHRGWTTDAPEPERAHVVTIDRPALIRLSNGDRLRQVLDMSKDQVLAIARGKFAPPDLIVYPNGNRGYVDVDAFVRYITQKESEQ